MAANTYSIKISPALADAIDLRSRQLGYASRNAYLKALARYDLMVQGEHGITLPISHLRLEDQDKIDSGLLRLTRKGIGNRGQWLQHAIQRAAGKAAPEQVPAQITRDLKTEI